MKNLLKYVFGWVCVLNLNCQAQNLIIYFDWSFNPHHAPLIIAEQQGIFKKYGLDIKMVSASGSEEGSRQVVLGNADIAVSKQSSHVLRALNHKLPLVRIATLIDRPLECLISLPSITSIKNLKGKRIGFTSSNLEFATYSIHTILRHNGVDPKDVTLIPLLGPMTSHFLKKNIDAIFSAYRTHELREFRENLPGVNVFYYEENGVPNYEQVILVTVKKSLNKPELKEFIQALRESCNFIKDSPLKAWESYIAYLPAQNTPHNKESFMQLVPLLAKDPSVLSKAHYEDFAHHLRKNNVLMEDPLPVSEYAVDLFS